LKTGIQRIPSRQEIITNIITQREDTAMRKSTVPLYVAAAFAIAVLSFGAAAAEMSVRDMDSGSLILTPGMVSSCQNDFIVENLDKDSAEIKIVLGNEEYANDKIESRDAKAYGLTFSLADAKMKGKSVQMNDVASILNTGEAKVKLHCLE
jgi:hypothetical protein